MSANGGGGGSAAAGKGGSIVVNPCPYGCTPPLVCAEAGCEPPALSCVAEADCTFDRRCVGGACRPFDRKATDRRSTCTFAPTPSSFGLRAHCSFHEAPPDDPFPAFLDVRATPMTARASLQAATSFVVAPFGGPTPAGMSCLEPDCADRFGILRVLDGGDCALIQNLGGVDLDGNGHVEWARVSAPVALGDLDGDSRPEIVAAFFEVLDPATGAGDEITIAFTNKGEGWAPLWPSVKAKHASGGPFLVQPPMPDQTTWAGPSVHDLDDDGAAELVREGWVVDGATGLVEAPPPLGMTRGRSGRSPVLGQLDVDHNDRAELTDGASLWGYDDTTRTWNVDPLWNNATTAPGFAAFAGFAAPADHEPPVIATVSAGKLTLRSVDGSLYRKIDFALPDDGGGPPAIADFDGDGLPEIALATAGFLLVIDPDCTAKPRPGGACEGRDRCAHAPGGACPDLVLWSRPITDAGEGARGVAAFDFDGDLRREIVHGDDCFFRVYDGSKGGVIASRGRAGVGRQDMPIVANVDDVHHAAIVAGAGSETSPSACAGAVDASGADAEFVGERCSAASDCPSGICDAGLCRCSSTAACCEAPTDDAACASLGMICGAPPPGTAGSGNTCRATRTAARPGLRIFVERAFGFRDATPIWHQHAFSWRAISEGGRVPRTSYWSAPEGALDGYREMFGTPPPVVDFTAPMADRVRCYLSAPDDPTGEVFFTVCNRGDLDAPQGTPVALLVGDQTICQTTVAATLGAGVCRELSCLWADPPRSAEAAVDVRVVVGAGSGQQQCVTTNDEGLLVQAYCKTE